MAQVKALIVTGYGTNCDRESAHAAREAGADEAQVIFFSDLAAGKARLTEANFLLFPGGFLDGDDLGAAQAAAIRWRYATNPAGTPILQPTDERRESGSHYTPRSLTQPIVAEALEPVLLRLGDTPTPDQVLDIKEGVARGGAA